MWKPQTVRLYPPEAADTQIHRAAFQIPPTWRLAAEFQWNWKGWSWGHENWMVGQIEGWVDGAIKTKLEESESANEPTWHPFHRSDYEGTGWHLSSPMIFLLAPCYLSSTSMLYKSAFRWQVNITHTQDHLAIAEMWIICLLWEITTCAHCCLTH